MSAFDRVSAMQSQPAAAAGAAAPRCITCQFTAQSREQLREHYKSEWHVHNSRRRAAGEPPASRKEFTAKLRKARAQQKLEQQRQEAEEREAKRREEERLRRNERIRREEEEEEEEEEDAHGEGAADVEPEQDADEFTCIFDRQKFATVEENMRYCHRRYGLFIPDQEYLTDAAGLMTYLNMKVKVGHVCLYCQRGFPSATACQQHMIDASHCKLLYEEDVDMHEYEDFYDFSSSYDAEGGKRREGDEAKGDGDDDEDEEIGELERKFEISHIGELVLLDGRTVGHRDLRRYYKQNVRPRDNRVAIVEQKKNIVAKIAPTLQITSAEIQALTIPQLYATIKARQKLEEQSQKRAVADSATKEKRVAGKGRHPPAMNPQSAARTRRDYNTPR